MARKTRLNQEIIEAITEQIRCGAFPHVAAQACGIPNSTFYRYMQKGEAANTGLYRELWENVRKAEGDARTDAENRVFKTKPEVWLRLGPGRSSPDSPGWTEVPEQNVNVRVGGKLTHTHDHSVTCPVSQATLIEALRELRDAGIDLNSLVDYDDRSISDDEDDLAEEIPHGEVMESLDHLPLRDRLGLSLNQEVSEESEEERFRFAAASRTPGLINPRL